MGGSIGFLLGISANEKRFRIFSPNEYYAIQHVFHSVFGKHSVEKYPLIHCTLLVDLAKIDPYLASGPVPLLSNGTTEQGDLISITRSDDGYRLVLDKWGIPQISGPSFKAERTTLLELSIQLDFKDPMRVIAQNDEKSLLDISGALSSRESELSVVIGANDIGYSTMPAGTYPGIYLQSPEATTCPVRPSLTPKR